MIRITEKSLVEQMGLNEREIARRLHMFDFTEVHLEKIKAALPVIKENLEPIILDFYNIQLDDSEVAAIIGDIDTLRRLQNTMRKYTLELFKGKFDLEYCNNRLRIGRVHKRLGVTPKLYMSAIATLQEILDKVIEKSFNEADATLTKDSFHKIILFDSQLVFEAYIDGFFIEMETAHEEVEKYATSLGVRLDTLTRHMHDISTRDALTGLHNRRSFFDHFSRECRVARRHKLPLTLMFMDLNNFKPINDAHGHDAGDLVLRQVGTSMMNITRNVDFPARYGGDEFCLILPRTTLEDTDIPISRLLEDFTERCEYPVTFSIGLVQTGPDEIMEPEDLITLADKKMYVAKARSKKDGAHHIEK